MQRCGAGERGEVAAGGKPCRVVDDADDGGGVDVTDAVDVGQCGAVGGEGFSESAACWWYAPVEASDVVDQFACQQFALECDEVAGGDGAQQRRGFLAGQMPLAPAATMSVSSACSWQIVRWRCDTSCQRRSTSRPSTALTLSAWTRRNPRL